MNSSSNNFDELICQRFSSWTDVIDKARNLKHFERRKLIKKYKRSLKRKHKAIEANKDLTKVDHSAEADSSDQFIDDILSKPFICSYLLDQTSSNSRKFSSSGLVLKGNLPESLINSLDIGEQHTAASLENRNKYVTTRLSPNQTKNKLKSIEKDEELIRNCSFFELVGACTDENCQKQHKLVVKSCVILISSMYYFDNLGISNKEKESCCENEVPDDFTEFYSDISEELKKFGTIKNLIVCCNESPQLKGNVYVEYETCDESQKAFESLQGRYYDGKMLNCTYVSISDWNKVLCKRHCMGKTCLEELNCNYLHMFSYFTNNDDLNCKVGGNFLKNKKHSKKSKKSKRGKLLKKNKKKKSKKHKKHKSSKYS